MARFNIPFFSKKTLKRSFSRKRDVPEGMWLKCPSCAEIVFKEDLRSNLGVCQKCGFHFQASARERLEMILEPETFAEWDAGLDSVDTLGFTGTQSYVKKLEQNIEKTGEREAIVTGIGDVGRHTVCVGAMDFNFLGASMGSVVGEKVTRLFERAVERKLPVVLCCASGGARMYEGMLSLFQMAKTSGAVARHSEAGLAYISILTHPTMAGVMASFATLGDVILAEPGALIGFAGPRVIKETTQSELPPGFQRSEFLLKHGLIDRVVERKDLKHDLTLLLDYLTGQPVVPTPAEG